MSKMGKRLEGLQITCPRVSRDYREPCATVATQEPEHLTPGAQSRDCREYRAESQELEPQLRPEPSAKSQEPRARAESQRLRTRSQG